MAKKKPATLPAVAAGVVAAGGAVVAGKLVHDRAEHRRREFRLHSGEGTDEGVRRIARGQLEGARDEIGHGDEVERAIHEARKALKRVRTVVRLARDPLGDEVYRRENRAFRDAGRELSDARDAQVLVATLDKLRTRFAHELPDDAFAGLRAALGAEAEAAHADGAARDELSTALADGHARVATWPLGERDDWSLLAPGFERIYRRGRRAERTARKDPSTEHLHELRKRAKDLWHAAQVLRPAAPAQLKRLGRRAHKLSDRLGDDHDHAVLLAAAQDRTAALKSGELELLEGLVARRRQRLQRDALRRAERVYAAKPKRWAKRIARGAAARA